MRAIDFRLCREPEGGIKISRGGLYATCINFPDGQSTRRSLRKARRSGKSVRRCRRETRRSGKSFRRHRRTARR
ncbi:MAG: hypothetical protein WAM82_20360 [Thermoanaerobaculia bacterium]